MKARALNQQKRRLHHADSSERTYATPLEGESSMSDPRASNDVSLDDLKRALDAVRHDHPYLEYSALECAAWRTAFQWRDNIEFATVDGSYQEGMRLIREKLG